MNELKGKWLVEDSYTDKKTGFLITETEELEGTLSDVMNSYAHHFTTSQLRFTCREPTTS